jgi:hypothetical protein
MSLPDALAEDRAARESPHAEVLNRFVVPAAKLSELPEGGPRLSVVLGSVDDVELVEGDERVEALELRLGAPRPRPADLVAAYRAFQGLGVETYFELVFDEGWRDSVPAAIGAIAAVGGRVKVRCGGTTVPSVEQLTLVIACCREAGVRFKATAGLHHAVRRDGEHGFLNVLAAAGAPLAEVPRLLAEEDAGALPVGPAGRESFVSFGSCDWRTPVEELGELGLLR